MTPSGINVILCADGRGSVPIVKFILDAIIYMEQNYNSGSEKANEAKLFLVEIQIDSGRSALSITVESFQDDVINLLIEARANASLSD